MLGSRKEEATCGHIEYSAGVGDGSCARIPALAITIDYGELPAARWRDALVLLGNDTLQHRDCAHVFSNELAQSA
ncbi:hypothetical protein [Rhodocyclus tenuis]|uniref:hypothetical protein n=1 Tax=Rhodocyclus tenuis TaxID=1066 RepID=UPI001907B626|nr:hypothetical protein [Rhodocyclus tenuis]MBK1680101.1 hypothetical protein [Rhodocyclus tenuis]